MGVDLSLMVVKDTNGTRWFAHTNLVLEPRRVLFARIEALPTRLVEKPFYPPGSERSTRLSAYGLPLRYALAGDLVNVSFGDVAPTPWNDAAWAYLNALPAETPVVLYWR